MLRQKIKEKKDMDGAGMQAKIELFYSSKVTSLFSNASRYSSNSNSKQSSARVSVFGNIVKLKIVNKSNGNQSALKD